MILSLDALELVRLTATHAISLRQLIGAADTPRIGPDGSQALMLAALQAAEIDLLVTLAHVSDDERETRPICGFWTLHDLIGHLADWDVYFANWLAMLRGEKARDLYWNEDGDAFNEHLRQQRRGETWAATWNDFRQRRSALIEALARVPGDRFMVQHPADADNPFPSIYHCAWSALEHYLDHAAGARRSLALDLPEQLLTFRGPYTE